MTTTADALQYIEYMRHRGRKQTTLDSLAASIRACELCLSRNGQTTDPEKITEDTFYFLRNNLAMKETSAQVRIRAYNQYIEWATGINWAKRAKLLWNPAKYDTVHITKEEFNRLLCFCVCSPSVRMILLLGGLMGLRRAEIASIKVQDIRGDSIIIHGKGHGPEGNVQPQRIPQAMRGEIANYLIWRKEKLRKDGASTDYFILFTEKYGHTSQPEYRNAALSWVFKKLSNDTGIHVTPHSLRRLYATTLYDNGNGADIQTVSKLLRHQNPTVTWRYIKQNDDHLAEIGDGIVNSLGLSLNMSSVM